MLPNASYFAFTATPKNKTLEIFGEACPEGDAVKHRPFHSYTMKQAIQEGFILDVLRYYTPVNSYYRLVKTVEADPEFDTKRATKKLRRYVESNDHAIRLKTEIMVDHFHEQVLALNKIGGQARAMVVTSGIERAIQYFQAVSAYLLERKSPYRAKTSPKASSKPSTWTAIGSRSRRHSAFNWPIRMPRSSRSQPMAVATSRNRNWTGFPTSFAASTISSAISPGRTVIAFAN